MDTVPNTFPSLFAGYTAIWLIFGFYLLSLGLRLARLEKRFGLPACDRHDKS